MFQEIRDSLRALYLDDPRPWLIGYSGGKDSTMLASVIFRIVAGIPREQRTKPVAVLCTDTRVESKRSGDRRADYPFPNNTRQIPAIVEHIEVTLAKMRKFSEQEALNIEVHLLRPPAEQSFWVNIIGRGYPPPNRTFRWCTQRMKIDPVTAFVQKRIGQWGEAILHLGARRAESATRAQTMANRESRNGLRRHPDLPRVWVSNPIEFLDTPEVWAYLLQVRNPWGGDNSDLWKLYHDASGECPVQIDTSTPACGNSRFGCWTCTVVERDKASEGLLAAGDERMEKLIEFRETLVHFRDPASGHRDMRRMNGADGPGPLKIGARKELLARLLALQDETGLEIISQEELFEIQKFWNSAREPDNGRGVAEIVRQHRGIPMNEPRELDRLREIEVAVAQEKGISTATLRRLLAKVEEYSEHERTRGLHEDLLNILKDDVAGV
jgi:DNA sulfur modification protein DndC